MKTIKHYLQLNELTDNLTDEECSVVENLPEYELEIEYHYTPGRPAKLFDIPENCHPEEPAEVEFECVELLAEKVAADALRMLPICAKSIDTAFKLRLNLIDSIQYYLDNKALGDVYDNERAISDEY